MSFPIDLEPASPSKTQRKKAMAELQALGEALVDLAPDRLKTISLPDDLATAIRAAQGMLRHDDARRRQLQFIGRLMRDVDAEPIRRALAAAQGDSADETAQLHRLERLRSELLADEKVLFRLATETPSIDLQHLRALRRGALLEQAKGGAPRCYREIFQFLKAREQEARALAADEGEQHADD